jgi:alanyl-tRNA synthetase
VTHKQFWVNPYQTRHHTRIRSASFDSVTLESTIFFAFSGGQESDHGTIAGMPVLNARKEGAQIFYTLGGNHGLTAEQEVDVEIDWTRRHRLMRLHFAAELVLELIYRAIPSIDKVGAHIASEKARIDFAWPESISSVLPQISREANGLISSNLSIRTSFEDEASERRYWEIEGFSRVPCGGTHVKSTGEVGAIRLKRDNKGRGKERVEIYLEC